jgi:hypothetical protein
VPEHSFTSVEAEPFIKFVNERHAIYMRKEILQDQKARGLSWPDLSEQGRYAWGKGGWTLDRLTGDPILGEYSFCNVFRELDRVTVWIRENIREPFADHEHLWFMLAIARFINWPETLDLMISGGASWPDHPSFALSEMTAAMEARKAMGKKVETGAYMIRAESDPNKHWYSWSKQRYVAEIVLGRPWEQRGNVRNFLESRFQGNPPTLQRAWEVLRQPVNLWVGWGPFMTGQVVADLRHTRYLRDAPDVGRWAPLGPGSTRGLNRLAWRPLKQAIKQEQGLAEMLQLQSIVNQSRASYVPEIELHDLQNCLCETDKYLRAQNGEGRPRAQYIPGKAY